MADEKMCNECRTIKPLSEFSPVRRSEPDGKRQGKCKPCSSRARMRYPYNKAKHEAWLATRGGNAAYVAQLRSKYKLREDNNVS